MQDLLTEDEFITVKQPTLWQQYKVFYIITLVISFFGFIIQILNNLTQKQFSGTGLALALMMFWIIVVIFTFSYKSHFKINYKRYLKVLMHLSLYLSISQVVFKLIADISTKTFENSYQIGELIGQIIVTPVLIHLTVIIISLVLFPVLLLIRKINQ
ncbi:hypothetical protein [Flavobacterium sp. C4GT6]|uniref:hypothetical protein n=1 Tax=Flavobacterium sp. C4GT6 TaxID=3103818 RepID=UPI002ED68661